MKNPHISNARTLYVKLAIGSSLANNKPLYLPQDLELSNRIITNIYAPAIADTGGTLTVGGITYTIPEQKYFMLTLIGNDGQIKLENFPLSLLTTVNQKGRYREFNAKYNTAASYIVINDTTGLPNIGTNNYAIPITFIYK